MQPVLDFTVERLSLFLNGNWLKSRTTVSESSCVEVT